MMVGAALPVVHRGPCATEIKPRLEVAGLSAQSNDPFGIALRGVSLEVHGGEIVGIAGVSGNGQSELLSLLSGELTSGRAMIQLDGESVGDLGVTQRRARGLAFVPEERLGRSSVPDMTLADNALLTGHGQGLVRRGLINPGKATRFGRAITEHFRVKLAGAGDTAPRLAGGYSQNVTF